MTHDKILILDFGSQYTQLIARRVREMGVYCEIHPFDWDEKKIASFSPKGIILSGGPESTHLEDAPAIQEAVFSSQCPLLGICYGMQALALQCGGQVESSHHKEFGHAAITVEKENILLGSLKDSPVWMSHGDKVTALPEGFETLAHSHNGVIAAIGDERRHYYGLQFHPEVTHTEQGQAILKHFVLNLAKAKADWKPQNIIDESVQTIRQQVGQDKVLLGLSGGVDSAVAAALLHKAIGDKLVCVFVDTGLLRHNEADAVMEAFDEHMGVNVIKVDASEVFYEALKGVSDPEEKRKVIGKTFVTIFERESKKIDDVKWLGQGTIYPDVIESAGAETGKAHVIKSHHNVGGLPEKMHLKLCEPLRLLFKDEVRKIGTALGLSEKIVYRHPFPGPGLGVRILGEIKPDYIKMLTKADHIFIETLYEFDYYQKVSQAFAVFLPVKSVGVKGDARCHEYVIALRAVETTDFMTAHWANLPYELLAKASNRIINEVAGISRVTYDISSKPPATIEWE